MTQTSDNLDFIDFRTSSSSTMRLTEAQLNQARQSVRLVPEDQQWQSYLNYLALLGFESWLQERTSNEFALHKDALAHVENAVSSLKIGEVKICLLTQGILNDEVVSLPEDVTNNISDYYVLLTVDEDEDEITIEGLIRGEQLNSLIQSRELIVQSDRTYDLPLSHFDFDINHLLLYLRFLQQPSNVTSTASEQLSNPINAGVELKKTVINVASWLEGRLDELSEGLSWLLFSTPQLATRDETNLSILQILQELSNKELSLTDAFIGNLPNVQLGEIDLKIYVLPYLQEYSSEWSLFFIVGTSNNQPLPSGFKLQVADDHNILSEQVIEPDDHRAYLYTQVIGEFDEQFSATISLSSGEHLTLPSFVYSFN